MKKILILICAIMLLCSAACADSASIDFHNRFELRGDLPSGWRCAILSQNDMTLEGAILPDSGDPALPTMTVFASFNESYAGVADLQHLDPADLERIRAAFSQENEVSFDTLQTASGVSLLVIRETGADQDFLDFYTVRDGYEIELTLVAGEGVPGRVLTDEQVEKCLECMKTLSIAAK